MPESNSPTRVQGIDPMRFCCYRVEVVDDIPQGAALNSCAPSKNIQLHPVETVEDDKLY